MRDSNVVESIPQLRGSYVIYEDTTDEALRLARPVIDTNKTEEDTVVLSFSKGKCGSWWHSWYPERIWHIWSENATTHVKISHLVTSLPTSRQQDVFALLVTSCQQVWNNLLTTCNNLVEIIRLIGRLF